MKSKVEALLNLLRTLESHGQKAFVLQTFVQNVGPIPHEYDAAVRACFNDAEMFQRPLNGKCPECGKEIFVGQRWCTFCGYRGGQHDNILLNTSQVKVLRAYFRQEVPAEVIFAYGSRNTEQITKSIASEFVERLIQDKIIEIDLKQEPDLSRNTIAYIGEARLRTFDPEYKVDYYDL